MRGDGGKCALFGKLLICLHFVTLSCGAKRADGVFLAVLEALKLTGFLGFLFFHGLFVYFHGLFLHFHEHFLRFHGLFLCEMGVKK